MEIKKQGRKHLGSGLDGWSEDNGWELQGEEERNGDRTLEGNVNKSIFHLPSFTYPGQVSDCDTSACELPSS